MAVLNPDFSVEKTASLFIDESGTILITLTNSGLYDERSLQRTLVLEVMDSFQMWRGRYHVVGGVISAAHDGVLVRAHKLLIIFEGFLLHLIEIIDWLFHSILSGTFANQYLFEIAHLFGVRGILGMPDGLGLHARFMMPWCLVLESLDKICVEDSSLVRAFTVNRLNLLVYYGFATVLYESILAQ